MMALYNDLQETRFCNEYTADCLGALVRYVYRTADFPLFSEYTKGRQPEQTAEQILEHVKQRFSGKGVAE